MRLALGTAQFGLSYGVANNSGQIDLNQGKLLLDCALKNGINTLDTAIAYGNSERRLGQIGVEKWHVVSKLPDLPDKCENVKGWVVEQVHHSIIRLGIDQLYGLLLHKPQQLLDPNGHLIYQSLIQLKADGLLNKIGISIYDPSELDLLCKEFDFDLIQAPFNILDRRILYSGWLTKLSNLGIEVHTRSTFLQGLLLMSEKDIPTKFDQWTLLWLEWFNWLKNSEISALEACLGYVLSFSEISKIVVGVDSITQLNQVIQATRGAPLNVPDKLKIDDINLINPANWALLN
jgi:aryl-alcohol dehydrogenase-like predicted oxidoreductase